MAAFLQGRTAFSTTGGLDFSLGFDMARKYSEEFSSYAPSYSTFSEEQTQSKHAEPLRVAPSLHAPPPPHYDHQQTATNHFTFNHSVTHVNLINNRFQIDVPPHQTHNPYAATSEYSPGNVPTEPADINSSMQNSNLMNSRDSAMNPYYTTGKTDISPIPRMNSFDGAQNHIDTGYHSPPSLNNNVPHSAHMMNMFQSNQHFTGGGTAIPSNKHMEDYSSIQANYNKYGGVAEHSLSLPNQFHNSSRKSEGDYSPSFYPDHPLVGSHASNLQAPLLTHSGIDKMPHIFPTHTMHKQRDHDVEQVNETQKCKNTIEGTKTSVRRFKRWYKDKYSKEIDMNSVNRFNAPELLKNFFLDIRDTRPGRVGNEYEPVTLTTYRNGLRRYFLYRKVPPAPDNFDLTDKTFDIVNRHLVTKRDDLKRKGKGNHPNAIESITPEQLEKMWATGAIGTHAPRPLLRLQWWYNTVYHGVRGRMAHHDLSTDDFSMKRDSDGKLLVEYNKKLQYNVPIGDKLEPPKKKKFKGHVKETDGGERDPLRAFELFKAHRPPGISSFYLTPKHKPKGNVWFNKVPMGKNSIGRIMREIKAIAGI